MKKQNVVLSLSGGLDSSTLLLRCLKEYQNVVCISFDYGQKHRVELERAQSLVDYLNNNPTRVYTHEELPNGFVESYSPINYRVIKLDGLVDLLNSTLVEGGDDVPEGHYEQDNMKGSVVPNRNKIFSSIIQAVALSISNKTNEQTDIALGIHAGDHQIYLDCRQEWRDADEYAFRIGNWDNEKVEYFTPYLEGDKFDILKDGEVLCGELGLNFNEIYQRTNTSYKPYPTGNSDYKSASSVERVEAFIKLGKKDPVIYEDETGVVSWEKVVDHVQKVLTEYHSKNQ